MFTPRKCTFSKYFLSFTFPYQNPVRTWDTIILLYYIYNRIDQCCITWLGLFIVPSGTNGCANSCTNSPEDGPVGPETCRDPAIYE